MIVVLRFIIKNVVSKVVVFYVGEEEDYIEILFGGKYILNNELIDGNVIMYDVIYNNVDYIVYMVLDIGIYYDF